MKRTLISILIMLFAVSMLVAQAKADHKGHKAQMEEHDCGKGHAMNRDCGKGHAMNRDGGHERPGMGMCQQLKLNPEQRQKIKTLHESHQKLANTVRAEIKNLKIDLRNAIENDQFSQARAIQKQIADKRLQIADARLNLMESVIKELTAEQREAFRKMRPMMGRGGEMFGGRHRREGGDRQGRGMDDCDCDCEDCH